MAELWSAVEKKRCAPLDASVQDRPGVVAMATAHWQPRTDRHGAHGYVQVGHSGHYWRPLSCAERNGVPFVVVCPSGSSASASRWHPPGSRATAACAAQEAQAA